MKKDVADLWVNALRSGEYNQGIYVLNNEGNFCCLGVLCEVAIKNGVKMSVQQTDEGIAYDGSTAFLPESVAIWAGINTPNGGWMDGHGNWNSLVQLNDSNESFDLIADIIDENVSKL